MSRAAAAGEALRAEWTKLRTLGSTAWLIAGAAAATIGLSYLVIATSNYQSGGSQDVPKLALTGVDLGQAVVAALAILAIGNEYHCGMMRVTLTAIPRRLVVLGAKAALVAVLAAVAGVAGVAGCLVAGRLVLPGTGFTAAHGYALISLAQGGTLRAAVGTVLYLALVALLSLGVATAVRDTATSIGIVFALLYLFPLLAQIVSDPGWRRHLDQIGPMTAGLAIQATTNAGTPPIGPWAGLGVLALWASGAMLLGGLMLRLRDA